MEPGVLAGEVLGLAGRDREDFSIVVAITWVLVSVWRPLVLAFDEAVPLGYEGSFMASRSDNSGRGAIDVFSETPP